MTTKDAQEFFMRFHDVELYDDVRRLAADTQQPIREVVERAVAHAFSSASFAVPVKETTADKLAASRERRLARVRVKR